MSAEASSRRRAPGASGARVEGDDGAARGPAEFARALSGPWLPRGRPLDFFALCIIVLGVGVPASAALDLILGARRSPVALVVARAAPILVIVLVVALIAVFRPEALAGRRPRSRRR